MSKAYYLSQSEEGWYVDSWGVILGPYPSREAALGCAADRMAEVSAGLGRANAVYYNALLLVYRRGVQAFGLKPCANSGEYDSGEVESALRQWANKLTGEALRASFDGREEARL